jgi:hypothetical protein
MTYKANQLVSALYAIHSGPGRTAGKRLEVEVPKAFRARIKHLLNIERARMEVTSHHTLEPTIIFHDERPRGKGNEVRYSARNAFALSVCVHLIDAGFPQLTAYEAVTALWLRLQKEYEHISAAVQTEGGTTFTSVSDDQAFPKKPARRDPDIKPADTTVFLLLPQLPRTPSSALAADEIEFIGGTQELTSRLSQLMPHEIHGTYLLELSGLITRVNELITKFPPKRRGPNN